jgi:hypothetical protein
MSDTTRLTIAQVNAIVSDWDFERDPAIILTLGRQLLATMQENERLRAAIANLEPLRGIEWHGKWRIHRCLDAADHARTELPAPATKEAGPAAKD